METPRDAKRIAVFVDSREWGGTEVHTSGYIAALLELGHHVTLVQLGTDVYDRFGPLQHGAYTSITLELPEPLELLPYRWWRPLFASIRPQICVLSKGWFGMRSWRLDAMARLYAKRYVIMEHHPAPVPPLRTSRRHLGGRVPGLGLWWWKQQVPLWLHLRSAHRVITDSDWVMSILCDEYTLPRAKAYLVHPGIDVDAFRFESEARGRFRAALGLPDDALVFGSVSRLARVKGLERSVKALSALQRAGCGSAWLVLAGIGPERGALEQLAIELGVRERVVFPGRVDHASDLLAALDVFLMPSREEGFGIALIEAMACERVCVAMNSGGPADILTDPSLGWLTPPDDEERFAAAAVEAAALGAHDRAAMGRRARAHVAARFNFRAQMRDIARLISA